MPYTYAYLKFLVESCYEIYSEPFLRNVYILS